MARLVRFAQLPVALALLVPAAAAQVRVACIGDSITYGERIADRENLSYPARLQVRLGEEFEVRNFGLSGRTLRRGADLPYVEEQAFHDAILWQPDIAIVMLGTNDTEQSTERPNWVESHDFRGDILALTQPLLQANPDLRVLLAASPKIADDTQGLPPQVVADMRRRIPRLAHVRSQLRSCARSSGSFEFIDLSRHLATHQYSDGYHPNERGSDHLAVRFATAIESQLRARDELAVRIKRVAGRIEVGSHRELETVTFWIRGHGQARVEVLRPERALEGLPWIYYAGKLEPRAEWFINLADRGFHVVVADSDRPWVTLPVEIAATLQRAGFGDGIDGRAITDPQNHGAITRVALRMNGFSADEAYPTTTPRSGVAPGPASDSGPAETWESVSDTLRRAAIRVGHVDALFLGGTTIQELTGHRLRAARPNGERLFDEFAGTRRVASLAACGERTEHLLWRIEGGFLDPMAPGAIVVHIGAHNILDKRHTAPETLDGIERIVGALRTRYPESQIVLCTPLPAATPVTGFLHQALESLRSAMLDHDFGPRVRVADTGQPFANPNGTLRTALSPDGITLTQAGQEALLGAIGPVLIPLIGM